MFGREDERGYDVANGWLGDVTSNASVWNIRLVFYEYWGTNYELLEVGGWGGRGGDGGQRALVKCRCIIYIAGRI